LLVLLRADRRIFYADFAILRKNEEKVLALPYGWASTLGYGECY
jgi:hypothetical protein